MDTCVLNCAAPFTEETEGACTVACDNDGEYPGTDGICTTCDVTNCKKCQTVGVCLQCDLGTDCAIDCTQTQDLPIHDYAPVLDFAEQDYKCVSKCTAANSVVSNTAAPGLNAPRCRYCGTGCEDCREDLASKGLQCWKCADGKWPYLDGCEDACDPPRIQLGNICI